MNIMIQHPRRRHNFSNRWDLLRTMMMKVVVVLSLLHHSGGDDSLALAYQFPSINSVPRSRVTTTLPTEIHYQKPFLSLGCPPPLRHALPNNNNLSLLKASTAALSDWSQSRNSFTSNLVGSHCNKEATRGSNEEQKLIHINHRVVHVDEVTNSNDFELDNGEETAALPSSSSIIQRLLSKNLPTTRIKFGELWKLARSMFLASLDGAGAALKQSWWCFPMILALVPVYFWTVLRTPASMPSWWSVQKLDHLLHSKYAALVIGGFLLSNIPYFISGLYLLNIIPPLPSNKMEEKKMKKRLHPSMYPLLGTLILASGAVSVLYHAVQALGPYSMAEALCYIDHAVAISAGFYYLHKCGIPSKTTLSIGTAGLVTLAMPGSGYAWLHSVWHLLSAAAAVCWAHDGIQKRKEYIVSARIRRRQGVGLTGKGRS